MVSVETEDDDEKEGKEIKSIQKRFMSVNEWGELRYYTKYEKEERQGMEWGGRHRVRRYALQWTGYSQGVKRC